MSLKPLQGLAIMGPGLMGLGLARLAARAGVQVALLGRDLAHAQAGHQRLFAALQRDVARGRLAAEEAAAQGARVLPADGLLALADRDMVIEALPEDRALKVHALAQMQAALPAQALLASNTSGLPIAGLALNLRAPERFLGLHFFSPVERMRLVEVVRGPATSAATLQQALHWVRQLGQQPIVVRDGPGFFTSRVFAAYLDEAVAMVGEGVAAGSIDTAALALGRAIGPLALLDDIGLRLNLQHADQARADDLPERFCRPLAQPVLQVLVHQGRAGRRDGGGFYEAALDGTRQPWAGLPKHFPAPGTLPHPSHIGQRLRWAEVLEALRCLEEGVITSADDADTASLLGLGFPAASGGLLRWTEDFGLAAGVALCDKLAREHGPRFTPSNWLRGVADSGKGLAAWRTTPLAHRGARPGARAR